MNREIKFRAWDEEEKRMKQPIEINFAMDEVYCDGGTLGKHTLMQFTGLKDKNGKEIYEGDIVKRKDAIASATYLMGDINAKGTSPFNQIHESRFEVIGNIYENPELKAAK